MPRQKRLQRPSFQTLQTLPYRNLGCQPERQTSHTYYNKDNGDNVYDYHAYRSKQLATMKQPHRTKQRHLAIIA